jgi:hypothetical protein
MRFRSCFVLALGWAFAMAPQALAAPPPNDVRSAAQPLGMLPADVRGTTVDAALDGDEPASGCAQMRASVWYAFDASESRSVAIALDADGELDAVVDVFVRERSQITPAACRPTNRRGALTFELDAEAGTSYLVRVASRANSVDGRFRLRVIEPERAASFPGARLPRRGVNAFVDRLANPDDAWSVRLRRGVAYRFNLVSSGGRCALVEFHLPGEGEIVRRVRCDGHTVFVPAASGLHTLHVQAPRASRERIRYRLRAASAAPSSMRSTSTASRSRAGASSGSRSEPGRTSSSRSSASPGVAWRPARGRSSAGSRRGGSSSRFGPVTVPAAATRCGGSHGSSLARTCRCRPRRWPLAARSGSRSRCHPPSTARRRCASSDSIRWRAGSSTRPCGLRRAPGARR